MPKGPLTYYQRAIIPLVDELIDPRHVEAYMRLKYDTLGGLDRRTFNREVRIAVACIQQGGREKAEALAISFGL